MDKLALNTKDKKKLEKLLKKPLNRLTSIEKRGLLNLGAKDFVRRFGKVIHDLAHE